MPLSPQERLDQARAYLEPSEAWDAWQAAGGECPPDWDALPSVHELENPLTWRGGKVAQPRDWPTQRDRILEAFRREVIGSWPEAPDNLVADILEERTEPSGAKVIEAALRFGPDRKAVLHAQLALPPGDGPFPVFMTQRNHEGWARIALARGYAAAIYDGCDLADDTQAFKEVWPEHDWSKLCRRAWGAGRVLDWLHTRPEIDRAHAAITGHSRNGKLSLICGAIDPRFTAVISSSSGIGGACPYRLANEAHFGEGIGLITTTFPEWFHPRLRFYTGREDKLPVDAHLLLALNAPRAVLVSVALNDPCEALRSNEAGLRAALPAFELFGADIGEKLRPIYRPGGHETRAQDIEAYVDWCDLHFRRATGEAENRLREGFPLVEHYPYRFEDCKRRSGASLDTLEVPQARPLAQQVPLEAAAWQAGAADRTARIRWLLGEAPPTAGRPKELNYGVEPAYFSALTHRPGDGFDVQPFNFGEYIAARAYLPSGSLEAKSKGPVVIWCPPDSTASGYSGAYFRGQRPPALFATHGFVGVGFDPVGMGGRLPEAEHFYDRYPGWSLLGKWIHDLHACIEYVLRAPWADPARVYLAGFADGGLAALCAAALDDRVAGVALASAFTPLRDDLPSGTPENLGYGRYGLRDGYGLLPRLGLLAGSTAHAPHPPIDFDEILAAVAPRPLLCVTPQCDREADFNAVTRTLDEVQQVYDALGASKKLWRHAPLDHRRFGASLREALLAELARVAGR